MTLDYYTKKVKNYKRYHVKLNGNLRKIERE